MISTNDGLIVINLEELMDSSMDFSLYDFSINQKYS